MVTVSLSSDIKRKVEIIFDLLVGKKKKQLILSIYLDSEYGNCITYIDVLGRNLANIRISSRRSNEQHHNSFLLSKKKSWNCLVKGGVAPKPFACHLSIISILSCGDAGSRDVASGAADILPFISFRHSSLGRRARLD